MRGGASGVVSKVTRDILIYCAPNTVSGCLCLTFATVLCYRLLMAINLLVKLSLHQLRRAVAIKKQIATLEAELGQLFGDLMPARSAAHRPGRKKVSRAARARISAAQKARWAKRAGKTAATPAKKAKRKVSAKARARLSALARARWAKAKAAGKKSLAS